MKKTVSLKWKIGKYLLIFGVLVIGMIFLFQIVLLRPMYETNRIAAVRRISDAVVDKIIDDDDIDDDDDDDELSQIIYDSQNETGTCVRVWRQSSEEAAARASSAP